MVENIRVVNFDGMDKDAVFQWCCMTVSEIARELLLPHQSRTVPQAYRNYAWNKYTAMQLREKGDITGAQTYEYICERIYADLPLEWRW